jgi:PAS domain S-box-containing protein
MSVGQKLLLGFLLVAALVGAVGFFGIRAFSQFKEIADLHTKVGLLLLRTSEESAVTFETMNTEDMGHLETLRARHLAIHDEMHSLTSDLQKVPELRDNADFQALVETQQHHDVHHDQIFHIRQEFLAVQETFSEIQLAELAVGNQVRLRLNVTHDPTLIDEFGSLEALGKEAIYRNRDQEHVDQWLQSIDQVTSNVETSELGLATEHKRLLLSQLTVYRSMAETLGQNAIRQREIEGQLAQIIPVMRQHEAMIATIRDRMPGHLSAETANAFGRNRDVLIATIAGAFLLAVGTGLVISRSISHPIARLRAAVVKLGRGDLNTRAKVTTRDEIGELAESFNQMAANLQQMTVSKGYVDNIMTSMTDSLIVVGPESRIRNANRAARELLGYAPEELIGMPAGKIFSGEEFKESLIDLPTSGPVREVERHVLSKDGRSIPISFSASAMRDSEGKVEGIVCVAQDTTERKQAEAALREAREHLNAVINSAPIVLFALDKDGVFTLSEGKALEALGRRPGQIVGQSIFDVHRDVPVILSNVRRALSGEACGAVVEVAGSVFDARYEPIYDRGGSVVGVVGAGYDITERQRAEEELSKSRDQLDAVLNTVGEGIVTVDSEGVIVMINREVQSIWGYRADELIGENLQILMPEQYREDYTAGLKRYRETGVSKILGKRLELEGLKKDGSTFPLELNIKETKIGENFFFTAAVSDITERKRAEEELSQKHELLQSIVDNIPVMVSRYDAQGRMLLINRELEKTMGWTLEEWQSRNMWLECLPDPEYRKKIFEFMMSEPKGWGDSRVRDKDGRFIDTIWYGVKLSDGSRIGIGLDITERKQAESQLKQAHDAALQASRAKSEFLAGMSHEIRTPMNAILGMAELLSETSLTPEQREYVRVFRTSGESLLDIINDILDLSKVEAGRLDLERVPFDLAELVENTAQILAVRAHEKGLELNCQIRPEVPTDVVGDPVRLRQIITNLVGNAIKFTEKGEVTLRVENNPEPGAPGSLLFLVADTGIGIPREKIDSIFDSFAQVDSSITRKYGGTGLGLAICRRLTELMGGRIWAESAVGQGSVFHFTANLAVQARSNKRLGVSLEEVKGLKTLVVDDNATNRLILQETLTAWGASVRAVEEGYRCLAELSRARKEGSPYQLLLLDRRMPSMDGFDVAERIQKDLGIADMTIMMLTSENRSQDITRCQELGVSRYLIKPVKRSDLLQAIRDTLSIHRAGFEELPLPPETAIPEDTRQLRILLVEDSQHNRLLVQSYLKKTPYQVDIAENGEVAVAKFMLATYDLVLMDVQMPVMDGYAATEAVREWERANGATPTAIIALTAHAFNEDVQKSLDVGCTAHLTKPIKKSTLLEAIRQHTRKVGT